jgi:peptidoglycan-associated lipoprotein
MTKTQWTTKLAAVVAAGVFGTIGCASSGSKIADDPVDSPVANSETPPATKPAPAEKQSLSGPIYFDTDRSELRMDAREELKSSAEAIQQHPEWGTLTIEGHCDERGSDEYNLALGERRAAKVKQYLKDLGVESKRLDTVSYGETKPAVRGHEESSWKLNRRSEIAVEDRHASMN